MQIWKSFDLSQGSDDCRLRGFVRIKFSEKCRQPVIGPKQKTGIGSQRHCDVSDLRKAAIFCYGSFSITSKQSSLSASIVAVGVAAAASQTRKIMIQKTNVGKAETLLACL